MSLNEDFDILFSLFTQTAKLFFHQSAVSPKERVATALQYHALFFLEKNPHARVSNIAQNLHISRSSATQLIERLTKIGLISRKSDEKDHRITHLCLAQKGHAELEHIKDIRKKHFKEIFSKTDERDIKELIRILRKLLKD